MCTSTISSTRISPSAIAEARSCFLRGISMFMTLSSTSGRFGQSAIGAPGGAREIAGVDRQVDAGDGAAHRREQPCDGMGDLDGLDHPVQRDIPLHEILV